MGQNNQKAFTLIELLVTLAVAAILAAVAIPSFTMLIRENRATTEANALLRVLTLARSEAIKRNRRVVVCIPADAEGESCSTTATRWDEGVMAFVDDNGNDQREAGEPLIHLETPFSTANEITGNNNVRRRIVFGSGGRLASGPGTINLSQDGAGLGQRELCLSTAGRTRIAAQCVP
jgi:type IV fimbrial biogenesis protein FimT